MPMSLLSHFLKKTSSLLIKQSHKWQKEGRLRDPSIWDCTTNEEGHLCIDGCSAVDLVNKYGSPLLAVNTKKLVKDSNEIKSAIKSAPDGSKVLYSYKTNCIPGILKEIHETGIGAEVISPYELWIAKELKVPGERIVYNGVDKDDESIRCAIEMGILSINIDYMEEVDKVYQIAKSMGKIANVGVRLGLSNGMQFGLNVETGEAYEACKKISELSDYLNLHCVHFNVASNTKESDTHKYYALKALNFMSEIKHELDIDIEYLDIGGGYGVPTTKNMSGIEYGLYRTFGLLPKPPEPNNFQSIDRFLDDVIKSITVECKKLNLNNPKLLLEPGRFVSSQSELLLTTVLAIKTKKDGTQYAITDAGRLSMTFPCDFEYHEILLANDTKAKLSDNYQIMGRICTSADWLVKNKLMPKLKVGDILAVMDAGAYFSSYSSTFAFPRPGIISLADGDIKMMRSPETYQYLSSLDVY